MIMRWRAISATVLVVSTIGCAARAAEPALLNSQILETVDWLANHKAGLGYDQKSRYTENLAYGDHVFRSRGTPKTMCVAAVFEIIIRTLAKTTAPDGMLVSDKTLPGSVLDGSTALNIAPYIFQYKSNVTLPDYKRKYSAGPGDAFVLFGIGRFVKFSEAKPGDFVYLNRENHTGHATVFIKYLDATGKITDRADAAKGFRYFSAQEGGTHGFGYRDAFFGACPRVTTVYVKDCNIIRSDSRSTLSVSRLYAPSEWYPAYSAIRVARFFQGDSIDTIFSDEPNFRKRGLADLAEAESRAKAYAKQGLFPLVVPKMAGESGAAADKLQSVKFSQEFGPDFSE